MAKIVRQNPGEFKVINGELNCLLCYSDNIRYDKQYCVNRHRNSKDHQQTLQRINNLGVQRTIEETIRLQTDFLYKVTEAFMSRAG